jgi:hypothetical protein
MPMMGDFLDLEIPILLSVAIYHVSRLHSSLFSLFAINDITVIYWYADMLHLQSNNYTLHK